MKSIKLFIGILIGIVITASIGVTATVLYNSSEIGFTPANSNWEVNNIQSAINDLYQSKGGLDDNSNVYSSDAKAIGKWINNKTIYQKTYTWTIENETDYDVSELGIDELVNISGKITHANGNQANVPYGAGGGDFVHLYLKSDKTNIHCLIGGSWNSGATAIVTLQYTIND